MSYIRSRAWKGALLAATLTLWLGIPATAQYRQTNLVSDIPGVAPKNDANPNLVNPWGIASAPGGPFWISDNGTGVSTPLKRNGRPFPNANSPLVVTIPPPAGSPAGTTAAPTGIVFNPGSGFVVSKGGTSGPAKFIFATEDGTISGWNPNVDATNAILVVDNSANAVDHFRLGAVYKGLAINTDRSGTFLYAANFRDGVVEIYNSTFNFVGSFTDPSIVPDAPTPGFAPFGIRNINGKIFVTFAMQNSERHDDVAAPGSGFVDVFDLKGNFIMRFATGGTLNSPWGLALAPAGFGRFSRDLLVGNFGDGRINAFDINTGQFRGQLKSTRNRTIAINGLWGITFGTGGAGGELDTLFFNAGIGDESHGLFGTIQAANQEQEDEDEDN